MPLRRGILLDRKSGASHAVSTSSGLKVRSRPEKTCVDFFTRHGIEFNYEPLLILAGKQYRPDFYLPKTGLFIEICGFTHMPYYRERIEEKRRIYAAQGLKVLFLEVRTGNTILRQLEQLLPELSSQ